MTDVDKLPPTQYLILDSLAARYRLGEQVWTFPGTLRRPIAALASAGLVLDLGGCTRWVKAGLTETGKQAALSGEYRPPNGGIDQLRTALATIAEYAEERADLAPGMDGVAKMARKALDGAA